MTYGLSKHDNKSSSSKVMANVKVCNMIMVSHIHAHTHTQTNLCLILDIEGIKNVLLTDQSFSFGMIK